MKFLLDNKIITMIILGFVAQSLGLPMTPFIIAYFVIDMVRFCLETEKPLDPSSKEYLAKYMPKS